MQQTAKSIACGTQAKPASKARFSSTGFERWAGPPPVCRCKHGTRDARTKHCGRRGRGVSPCRSARPFGGEGTSKRPAAPSRTGRGAMMRVRSNPHPEEARSAVSKGEAEGVTGLHPSRRAQERAPQDEGLRARAPTIFANLDPLYMSQLTPHHSCCKLPGAVVVFRQGFSFLERCVAYGPVYVPIAYLHRASAAPEGREALPVSHP